MRVLPERIFDKELSVWAGSAQRLPADLSTIAPRLGLKLGGELSDELAGRIDDMVPLAPDEPSALVDDTRTAWLLLYEGARLATLQSTALCLAG